MTWLTLPLHRKFRIVNGGTPTSEEQNWGGEVPWATPVDLGGADRYIAGTQRTLTRRGLLSGSRSVPSGSLLVSSRAPIGYVAVTTVDTAFNQGCKGLLPIAPVDIDFFYYQMISLGGELQSRGQGSTFLELSSHELGQVPICSPPLEDQRRIAEFLDVETLRLNKLAGSYVGIRKNLLERRAAVVFSQTTGADQPNLKSSRMAWVDRIPDTWSEPKINFVACMGSGHTPSRARPEWWIDCNIPWITTGEVSQIRNDRQEVLLETREKISELGVLNSSAHVHPAGTVVLSRTAASAGFSAVMGTDMATSQDIVTWTCGPRLNPYYLLWCLRAMRSDLLGRLAMGSTHKTIYVPDLQGLKIPLPPLHEQQEIVDRIRESNRRIDALIDAIDAQSALLAERRQALITAAVTGQIDVSTARGVDV